MLGMIDCLQIRRIMKLVRLINITKQPASDQLMTCHLCKEEMSFHLAIKNNWVKDLDMGNFVYCPDCESFLIKDLEDGKFV